MIYCTLLNPTTDLICPVPRLVAGSTIRETETRNYPAGKGINVASVVRAMGEEACVIGIMPEGDRHRFAAYLENRGVGHHFFPVPGDVGTNVTIVEQNGQTTHLCGAGTAYPKRIQEDFMRFAAGYFKEGDLWCCTGPIPSGFDDDAYATLIRFCKESGMVTFLDTRGRPLRLGVRAKPHAVKPNSAELEDLFGEQIKGVRHIALKGKKLMDRGVPYVFISLGSDGMIAVHDNDCMLCVPPQVATTDTAGCGDALMAGLLVAWNKEFSFTETCRLALACGASKAMHHGPHTVSREEVWRLMEEVKITAI